MTATPEIPRSEAPKMETRAEEFVVPETLQQSTGVKAVQKTFKTQVNDDKGQAIIQTPPTEVITVTPPTSEATLTTWAKGPITSSLTWFGAFWIRVIKKALHFGWKVTGGEVQK